MRILIFGTGDYYNRYKKWFVGQEILSLLDNSEQKKYTFIDGLKVLPPKDGVLLDYDIVVILSFHVKQMKQQLISLGVEPDRIYHFFDLHRLITPDAIQRPLQYFLDAKDVIEHMQSAMPKILLLSQDLTLGGPAIALFHAAIVLKENGYIIVYASMLDGPLREKLMEKDIPVMVDENLQIATMRERDWVSSFSLIICNTMNFHVFLSDRDTEIPVIWWMHDAPFFYDGVDRKVIEKISQDNLKLVSVGPIPAEAVREFRPDLECSELLYGVTDYTLGSKLCQNSFVNLDKVYFIMIGFFEEIKGQDILVQAIKRLSEDIRNQCRFYMVGHNMTLFGECVYKESREFSQMIFMGSVDRQEIHKLLSSSNVLICPSRQDSMPTVVAEAMMHSIPCIVSDATGTATYIHDGEDGFVFPNEDAGALAERIGWCVMNKSELEGIGKKARRLYEKYFSMSAFEKRFMEVIHEALKQ